MLELNEYIDYRDLFRDKFNEIKTSKKIFSYRFIGKKLNLDPSFIAKVLKKQFHLKSHYFNELNKLFDFSVNEIEYLNILFQLNQSVDLAEKEALEINRKKFKTVLISSIEKAQKAYLSRWYCPVIRSLLPSIKFFNDFEGLANLLDPAIKAREVKSAIDILLTLGLIELQNGFYKPTSTHLKSGQGMNDEIKRFHHQILNLAQESLENQSGKQREISSITIEFNENNLDEIRDVFKKTRLEILKMSDIQSPEQSKKIFQINFQAIPITKSFKKDLL